MGKGELWINGHDAMSTYGLTLGKESLTALMTPAPLKAYITSKCATMSGKQVIGRNVHVPKADERDLQLTLYIHANGVEQFVERYTKLCREVFAKGYMEIETRYQPDVVYRCLYLSCQQFKQFNGRLGKFVLKLNEPNPDNRKK